MMLPTGDEILLDKAAEALRKKYMGYGTDYPTPWKDTPYQDYWKNLTGVVLKVAEKEGYHKGLPDSIAEALNSGDGIYRP